MRYLEILSEAKFDITQTDAFKRWFEGSKVVDESGRPLRLYHGTTHGHIDKFEVGFNSFGNKDFAGNHKVVSFTTDPSFANGYAGSTTDYNRRPVLIPVYIRALNPGDFRNPDHVEQLRQLRYASKEEWYLSVMDSHAHIWTPERIQADRIKEFAMIDAMVEHGAWQMWENPVLWKQCGWDGAWAREDRHHHNAHILNFAVADGRQVKSAVGNRNFNADNPKLTEQHFQ